MPNITTDIKEVEWCKKMRETRREHGAVKKRRDWRSRAHTPHVGFCGKGRCQFALYLVHPLYIWPMGNNYANPTANSQTNSYDTIFTSAGTLARVPPHSPHHGCRGRRPPGPISKADTEGGYRPTRRAISPTTSWRLRWGCEERMS